MALNTLYREAIELDLDQHSLELCLDGDELVELLGEIESAVTQSVQYTKSITVRRNTVSQHLCLLSPDCINEDKYKLTIGLKLSKNNGLIELAINNCEVFSANVNMLNDEIFIVDRG